MSPAVDAYREALRRLAVQGRRMAAAEAAYSPTPQAKELDAIAKLADDLHLRLAATPVWSELEDELGSLGDHYGQLVLQLAHLRDAAKRAHDHLPDARSRPVAPWIAAAYLYLRYQFGLPSATKTRSGPAARELGQLLKDAGLAKSDEAVFALLKAAINQFDPHLPPPGLDVV